MLRHFPAAFALLSLLALAGCGILYGEAYDQPYSVMLPASFSQRQIPTSPFAVTASERIRAPGQVGAVYMGDEGQMALGLASKDVTPNVFYLGHPCDFDDEGCIASLSAALDDIKAHYQIFGFNLVGYAEGASSAALLAAGREDILSLRTVAGKLDPAASVAEKILRLPQKHFVSGEGKSGAKFIAATNRPDCISLTTIEGSWTEKWAELLEQPLEGGCQ